MSQRLETELLLTHHWELSYTATRIFAESVKMQCLTGHPSPSCSPGTLGWGRSGVWGQQWPLPQWGVFCLLAPTASWSRSWRSTTHRPNPPYSCFVHKVLLERSHTYLFNIYGWFDMTAAELSSWDKEHVAHRLKRLLLGPLQKKCADSSSGEGFESPPKWSCWITGCVRLNFSSHCPSLSNVPGRSPVPTQSEVKLFHVANLMRRKWYFSIILIALIISKI